MECPKCKSKMVKGHSSYGRLGVWILAPLKTLGKPETREMNEFACEKCGYIERYVEVK